MPRPPRPPLFTALSFEPIDLPSALHDPEFGDDIPQREAKRRRIESIAEQYLNGFAPVIRSAALKGPFPKDWKNPWASKKAQSDRPEPSGPPKIDNVRRHKERQARAEAQRVEEERRTAKAERKEHRRLVQKKREERATELRRDGLGKTPKKPVDLTVEEPAEEDARNRDYGSREIRSSFTDEWLRRLGPPDDTPEPLPEYNSAFQDRIDELERATPSKRSRDRSHHEQKDPTLRSRHGTGTQSTRHASLRPEKTVLNTIESRSSLHPPAFDGSGRIAKQNPRNKSSSARTETFSRAQGLPQGKNSARALSNAPPKGTSHHKNTDSSQHKESNSIPQSLQVNFNEDSLARPICAGHAKYRRVTTATEAYQEVDPPSTPPRPTERVDSICDDVFKDQATPPSQPDQHTYRKHPSGFTPINHGFISTTPAGSPEHIANATPRRRNVLGVRNVANDSGVTDAIRPTLQPTGQDVMVMAAGQIPAPKVIFEDAASFEGQENTIPLNADEKQVLSRSPLKETLLQSAEKCVAAAFAKPKKPQKDHPLQASPTTAVDSPGFTYRKVVNPTENVPKLIPTSGPTNRLASEKRRARLMAFGSSPIERTETHQQETVSTVQHRDSADAAEQHRSQPQPSEPSLHKNFSHGSRRDMELKNLSQARDFSTQAAIILAQEAFQQQMVSPLKDTPAASPLNTNMGPQQTRTSTPASEIPVAYTAITPFKDFNKGKPFLAENVPNLAHPQMSTQELLNTASPFAFSTIKKNKRKRVSLAASPLKFAEKPGCEDLGSGAGVGVKGQTTVVGVTITGAATPASPKDFDARRKKPSFGLKPQSLNPTLAEGIKLHTLHSSDENLAEATPTNATLPKSSHTLTTTAAPTRNHPVGSLRQRQSHSQSRAGLQQSHSSLPPGQKQSGFLDEVDLDSAMDAADTFLDSWNIGADLRQSGVRSGGGSRFD